MDVRVGALLLAQLLVGVELGKRGLQDQDVLFPGVNNSSVLTWPCGQRNVLTRVIGGKDSKLGRWPWQGSLRLWGYHQCGATLLNRRWVLSAAHCFQTNNDPYEWTVQFALLPPYNLQEVEVAIINNSRCNYLFGQPSIFRGVGEDMICAGAEEGGIDSCRGDSGGPVVCQKNGLWIQVGIVSGGSGCGRPNRPGIYTNVSRYFSWMQTLVGRSTPKPDPTQLLLPLALLWAAPLLQLAVRT
nr:PREDICTED: putative serine protease 41 isoform X2 [Equus przewalskii]